MTLNWRRYDFLRDSRRYTAGEDSCARLIVSHKKTINYQKVKTFIDIPFTDVDDERQNADETTRTDNGDIRKVNNACKNSAKRPNI